MKSMAPPSYRVPAGCNSVFTRPKTAVYSYKKLTEILQGKYMSIQNKITSKQLTKNCEQKKKQAVVIQPQGRLQSAKKVTRNPSIENCKISKQNGTTFTFTDFDRLKRTTEFRTPTKQIQSEKENKFVPYAKQQQYVAVSQPSIPPTKIIRSKKSIQNDKQKLEKTSDQIQVIQQWKNEDQNLNFSSLFKKSWRF